MPPTLNNALKDTVSDIIGTGGVLLTASATEMADTALRLLGAIGGIILLYWSIRHKILLVREKQREIEQGKSNQSQDDDG
jgi:hypothetical protein